MFKKKSNALSYIVTVITFIFFLGFVYFSYFTAKELLILRVISPQEHAIKFDKWAVQDCNHTSSYRYEKSYSSEIQFRHESDKQYKNRLIDLCKENLYTQSGKKQKIDFEYNIAKYGLATLFFFILFISFAVQSSVIYRKHD